MVRTSAIIRELVLIGLCLILAVWLSGHSLGGIPTPKLQGNLPKPFATRNLAFTAKKIATVWMKGKTEATVYRVYHKPPESWRIEYLAPKEARGRVMIQSDHKIWQIEPSRKRIFVTSATGDIDVYEKIDRLLSSNYTSERLSKATEAGRKCSVLRLTPIHDGKSAWQIWVDDETGVIIKRERYDSNGGIELVSQYVEFKPGEVDKSLFDTNHLPHYPVVKQKWNMEPLPEHLIRKYTGLQVSDRLPNGFELKSAFRVGESDSAQLTFSDGLCVMSLFACNGSEPGGSDKTPGHSVKIGKIEGTSTSFGHMGSITWEANGHTCTLMADSSEHVMLDLARSLM